jgi:hypothetical protein
MSLGLWGRRGIKGINIFRIGIRRLVLVVVSMQRSCADATVIADLFIAKFVEREFKDTGEAPHPRGQRTNNTNIFIFL